MPIHASQTLTRATWTQLTTADVTSIYIQNQGKSPLYIKITTTATAPTDQLNIATILYPGEYISPLNTLAQYFPGLTGGVRVYGYSPGADCTVFVSHA